MPKKLYLKLGVYFADDAGAADDCESFKNPVLFITTPGNLEALNGSCLQVPCNFSAKGSASFTGENFGVWIKSDPRFKEFSTNVIFNSSRSINTYPLEITGNLERQDCTTVFHNLTREHSDMYFFRIEHTQFQATASCSGFRLTVRGERFRIIKQNVNFMQIGIFILNIHQPNTRLF